MSKELTRKRKSPEPSLGDAVNPELTCGNMRLHPNTVLGCTHIHTIVEAAHTEIKKRSAAGTRSRGGGGGAGRKNPLKGYIPRDIYSLRRRLGFQTSSTGSSYNVFDGSTNTPWRQFGRWPFERINLSLSGNSLETTGGPMRWLIKGNAYFVCWHLQA